jgi:hypothetical protein
MEHSALQPLTCVQGGKRSLYLQTLLLPCNSEKMNSPHGGTW